MEKYFDIVIIGGSAGGISALKTSSIIYKNKSKLLIKKDELTPIPCAIPYTYKEIGDCKNNIISNSIINKLNSKLLIGNVKEINYKNKELIIENQESKIKYDKLIIATGSKPIRPPIKNIEANNVEFISKNVNSVNKFNSKIEQSNNIVIIGGGYIGVESAENIKENSPEKNITIIEGLERCLEMTFDKEFSNEIEDKLRYVGIKIITSKFVSEITKDENNNVNGVILNDSSKIEADFILVGVGAKANSDITKGTEIELNKFKDIKVNQFQETNIKDIFAVGDVSEKKSFFDGNIIPIKLASIASKEGSIAALNLYTNQINSDYTIGAYSTKIHDKIYSGTGLTEEMAIKKGFEIITGNCEVSNRHPNILKDSKEIKLKLIFNKLNLTLIGAQISGPSEVGEIINLIETLIKNKNTIYDLIKLEPATHPKVTSSPVGYHIISAVENALIKLN